MSVTSTQAENARAAVAEFISAIAAIEAALALADAVFDSLDDALSLRDEVLGMLDAVIESTADDDVFASLSALRAAVVSDVAARGADLARIVRVTPNASTPALVLAHRLYDDPSRDQDIVTRNRIARPGFLPAVPLEVLTNG